MFIMHSDYFHQPRMISYAPPFPLTCNTPPYHSLQHLYHLALFCGPVSLLGGVHPVTMGVT